MKTASLAALVASTLSVFGGLASAEEAKAYGQCGGKGFSAASCPTSYVCTEINEYYSQCVPEGESAFTMPEEVDSHGLKKRQTSPLAIVGPTGGVRERLPIQRLQTELPSVFNMFILGLYEMQQVAEANGFSYYEIAGIHGAPFKGWGTEGTPSNPPQLGYCTHSSALFGTWHRPYLSLIEQRIQFHAIQAAARFTGATAAGWRTAATQVRLPYWDWSASDLRGAIPQVVMTGRIAVTAPGTGGAPVQVTIDNPVYNYRFTSNRKNTEFRVARLRDAARTRRHPPADMSTSNNVAANNAMRNGYTSRRTNTFNLFSITNFNQFSNRAWNGGSPGQFVSVESVHDQVHVALGGQYGHMTFVEYSSFDPIFFLHHCNVDRLVAMYQGARPGLWVQPQTMSTNFARPNFNPNQQDTIDTPLNPFTRASGRYWNSRDVSRANSIWALGYAYPEVPASYQGRTDADLQTFVRARVNALYGPNGTGRKRDDTLGHKEWLVSVLFNEKDLFGPTEVLVFLGDYSTDPKKRIFDENFVGAAAAFSSSTMKMDKDIANTIPLSESLRELGVDLNDKAAVVAILKDQLRWVVMSGDKEIPYDQMPSLKIGVSAADVTIEDGLPKFGEFETFYQVTEDRPAGFTIELDEIIKSKPGQLIKEVKEAAKEIIDLIKGKRGRN